MLVLTRKPNESIDIGGVICIRVLAVVGSRVRLGIEAPDSVSIRRGEVVDPTGPKQVEIDQAVLEVIEQDILERAADA